MEIDAALSCCWMHREMMARNASLVFFNKLKSGQDGGDTWERSRLSPPSLSHCSFSSSADRYAWVPARSHSCKGPIWLAYDHQRNTCDASRKQVDK